MVPHSWASASVTGPLPGVLAWEFKACDVPPRKLEEETCTLSPHLMVGGQDKASAALLPNFHFRCQDVCVLESHEHFKIKNIK